MVTTKSKPAKVARRIETNNHKATRSIGSIDTADSVKRVLSLIKEKNVQVVDVKFTDLPGQWQHFSLPAATFDEDVFEEGLGFDGSSIRGFQAINESDMLLIPDPSTGFVDPVLGVRTLSVICDI